MRIAALVVSLAAVALAQTNQVNVLPSGTWEGEIRDQKRPVVIRVDFTAQTISFSGAAPIPINVIETVPAGRTEFHTRVLTFNGTMIGESLEGEVTGGDAPHPFRIDRLAPLAPPASREDGWRQDLAIVSERFLQYDRSFTDAQRASARARLQRLQQSLAAQDDAHLIVELARIVASSGNAHTRLYLVRNRSELPRLPVRVWWFQNELRIVATTPNHTDLLGCRIERIGESSAAAAAAQVRGIKAGSASWQRYMSAYFLTAPGALVGSGVVASGDQVVLRVRCGTKSERIVLAPMPFQRRNQVTEAWWDLVPSYPQPEGPFVSLLTAQQVPRYLRNVTRNYWFEYVPEDRAVYFQYNRAEEMPDVPMKAFTAELAQALNQRDVAKFIVDVRFNTGGNLEVATPLVMTLAANLKGVPVVVLTGRATFSAGITHAAQWKQLAGATIVGEPAGDGLDMWSEGGNLVLPNSGLTLHYGNAFHSYSRREYPDRRPYYYDLAVDSLEPAVRVEPTWRDYVEGKDPVYDAAVRIRPTSRTN